MYTNYHLSTPSNNANDVVNSSAPSNVSDSARVDPNQTPRCDASSCSFSDSTYMSIMSHQWSGSNPPPGVAPGCAPDSGSAWNSSPASVSHAFNLGCNMVAAWGGRPPSIGDAFTQGTVGPGGRFKNTYELLKLRTLKISMLYKNRIFQCVGKIFCVGFQRFPLKFHTKYLIHTLKDVHFIHRWNFKSS